MKRATGAIRFVLSAAVRQLQLIAVQELTELEILAAKHIRNRALVSEIRNQLAI